MTARRSSSPQPEAPTHRERWSVENRQGSVAHLDIPADAARERVFEVFCSLVVMHRDAGDAFHGLRVLVDGAHEWSRRVATHNGAHDSLDLRFRRSVGAGRALRVTAIADVEGATLSSLSIAAEED